MFLNSPSHSVSMELKDAAISATVDFVVPQSPGVYMVVVRDNSGGSLGIAWLYLGLETATPTILQDATTGGLMTGACPPTIYSTSNGKITLRFTNASTARKLAVIAIYNPVFSAGINY